MKKALITGIGGQDGSYMAELLLEKGYEVHGMVRRSSTSGTDRIQHLVDQEAIFNRRLFLHYGDLLEQSGLEKIIHEVKPDEVYNLAAQSQVRVSYDIPIYTMNVTGLGFARLLEAVRNVNPKTKVYQACSSEMYGRVLQVPQNENTPFNPLSPYGEAKAYSFFRGRNARESWGMPVYIGILFNHESPRRGEQFLSKKVVKAAVRIKKGEQSNLFLGNLDAKRDWGYAKEYVYWIWKIMQSPEPTEFVIASGENYTVKEFVAEAFKCLDLNWQDHVKIDESFLRPNEVNTLVGDYSKAKKLLGYEPKTKFKELIKIMVEAELNEYK